MGRHGKGVGLKSHDCFGAFGCSACHQWYDTTSKQAADYTRQQAEDAFWLGFERTLKFLWEYSYIVVHRRG